MSKNYNEKLEEAIDKTEDSLKDLISSTNTIASSNYLNFYNNTLNFLNETKKIVPFSLMDFKQDEKYFSNTIDTFYKELDKLIVDSNINNQTNDLFDKIDEFKKILPDLQIDKIDNLFNENFLSKFSNRYRSYSNEFGLWAYPTPSTSMYMKCKQIEGSSVWDENGYWRCLFPRAKINPLAETSNSSGSTHGHRKNYFNQVITKEDLEENSDAVKGLKFFNNYTDYLDWKSKMIENLKNERKARWDLKKQRWLEFKESEKNKWKNKSNDDATGAAADATVATVPASADTVTVANPAVDNDFRTDITGSSTSIKFHSLPSGESEKIEVIQNWFPDGRSEIKEIKTLIDKDGKKSVNESLKTLEPSKDWFWSSK
ncbi:hypothetical protein B5S33_g4682 [[Candida] boidinii]|nr:hypothetical protein B5S33_g4682 [[Candida] boidinii]